MSDPTPPPGTGRDLRLAQMLGELRKAIGDTWAGPEPVGADEARTILDAVAAVLGVTPPNTDPLFPIAALHLDDLTAERDEAKAEVANQQRAFELMLAEVRDQRDEARAELGRVQAERDELDEELDATNTAHGRDMESWRRTTADRDRLRAELADAKAALRKVSAGIDTSAAINAADIADAIIQDRNERILRVSARGHDAIIAAVAAARDEARVELDRLRALLDATASPPQSTLPDDDAQAQGHTGTGAQGGPQADWREIVGKLCTYTDHDLFTNRRLTCDKRVGHTGMHRLVWADGS